MSDVSKVKRNVGIDFLRIWAMFYVVVLHTFGHGGILSSVQVGTHQYMVSWFIEIWAYCAVDLFALISGYVGYHEEARPVKYTNYISLWMQVVFYGVITTLIFHVSHPGLVTKMDLLEMFFPVTNGLYWYFTAYTGLFLCMPLLNMAMSRCTKKMAGTSFLLMFLCFSVFDSFVGRFALNRGYCFTWLVILYILGSAMKKCSIGENIRPVGAFIGIFILVLISWGWKIYGMEWSFLAVHITQDTFVSYTSPTIVGIAILYIIAFSRIQFQWLEKMILFATPGVFAVYLLNEQRFIRKYGIVQRFTEWAGIHSYLIPIKVFAFAIAFVIVSILIDRVRAKLFQLFHINFLIEYLGTMLGALMKKIQKNYD